MMDWYSGSHMGSGDWFGMTVLMALVWACFIVAAVLVFRGSAGWKSHTPPPDAVAILDERFARGELDADEYETRRSALRDWALTSKWSS